MHLMRELKGRLALVTGAGSGIGRATAHALATEGMRVIVVDRDASAADDAARSLGSQCALALVADVSDRDAMRSLAERVHATAPALDVLVNNAGVAQAGRMIDTPLADWDHVLGVNLWGVVHGCHFFVPKMVARGAGGHVVNVSSMVGLIALPGIIAYTTSKFAVRGLTEALRAELAPHRIGVSGIFPGITRTGIVRNMRFSDGVAMQRSPIERYGARIGHAPESVAREVVRAIRRDHGRVPVSFETRTLAALDRISPRATGLLASAIAHVAPGRAP
jgi:NAD(P)-dependent dehydrogenase (short-subunit alcohol dehydrogenase family)